MRILSGLIVTILALTISGCVTTNRHVVGEARLASIHTSSGAVPVTGKLYVFIDTGDIFSPNRTTQNANLFDSIDKIKENRKQKLVNRRLEDAFRQAFAKVGVDVGVMAFDAIVTEEAPIKTEPSEDKKTYTTTRSITQKNLSLKEQNIEAAKLTENALFIRIGSYSVRNIDRQWTGGTSWDLYVSNPKKTTTPNDDYVWKARTAILNFGLVRCDADEYVGCATRFAESIVRELQKHKQI